MNLFHLNGFKHEQALKEWTLVFKKLNGFVEKKNMYKCTLEVIEDSHEYKEVDLENGNKFMPESNENEMITVFLSEKPKFEKFVTVEISGVKNAYIAGDNKKKGRAIFEAERLLQS
ncbi:hypothetical protein [Staphylococcus cohnii]|uniref:hypothetical protein n=1 Tax=Staphylococcus cohnii TaxID=29382 RepID=UPI0011A3F387|nr:hypothetical protein [Staphylococcus cohnii]